MKNLVPGSQYDFEVYVSSVCAKSLSAYVKGETGMEGKHLTETLISITSCSFYIVKKYNFNSWKEYLCSFYEKPNHIFFAFRGKPFTEMWCYPVRVYNWQNQLTDSCCSLSNVIKMIVTTTKKIKMWLIESFDDK